MWDEKGTQWVPGCVVHMPTNRLKNLRKLLAPGEPGYNLATAGSSMDDVQGIASFQHNILQFQKSCGATLDESSPVFAGEKSWASGKAAEECCNLRPARHSDGQQAEKYHAQQLVFEDLGKFTKSPKNGNGTRGWQFRWCMPSLTSVFPRTPCNYLMQDIKAMTSLYVV